MRSTRDETERSSSTAWPYCAPCAVSRPPLGWPGGGFFRGSPRRFPRFPQVPRPGEPVFFN